MVTLRDGWNMVRSVGLWVRSIAVQSDREHIFVTGAPRSGTTLMKTILTAHPEIAGGDYESTGLFKIRNLYAYSCGEIENGWIHVSCEEATDVVDFYDQLAKALLECYDGQYFVDKIWPRRYRLWYVVRKFPKARWIHMIRDGRDSYCSAREHPNIPQSENLERFAKYWQCANRWIEEYVPVEDRVRIRYEDLTRHPETEIERTMEALGLTADPNQFHPAETGDIPSIHKREHHRRLAQPLDTRSVGRSTDELSDREKDKFDSIAHESLKRYSYL